jgi:acyl-CoA thioesterase FadM
VAEKKRKALTYQIRVRRIEPGPIEEVAVGRLVVVCVEKGPDGRMQSVEIPAALADQIQAAPPELLALPAPA